MQEEVENRTVNLVISTSKLTANTLIRAMQKYLQYCSARNTAKRNGSIRGKQTVKQLVGQRQGVSTMDLSKTDIRGFEKAARKYGVDYAVKRVKGSPPRYLVFFKANDADALTQAFQDYCNSKPKKLSRPSVLEKLNQYKELVKNVVVDKTRHKELER